MAEFHQKKTPRPSTFVHCLTAKCDSTINCAHFTFKIGPIDVVGVKERIVFPIGFYENLCFAFQPQLIICKQTGIKMHAHTHAPHTIARNHVKSTIWRKKKKTITIASCFIPIDLNIQFLPNGFSLALLSLLISVEFKPILTVTVTIHFTSDEQNVVRLLLSRVLS